MHKIFIHYIKTSIYYDDIHSVFGVSLQLSSNLSQTRAAAYKADLGNTETLMQMLDNPYKAFRSIHVAGTNGKGSTSHFLASILFESGIKTGLHTSPHLRDLRERIAVDGKLCSKVFVSRFWKDGKTE